MKQRVALRCALVPLTLRETAAYVAKRISLAGGDSLQLFSREAIEAVHYGSGGIPRLINVICDNALVNGMAAGVKPVGRDIVRDVCLDFDLPVATAQPSAPTGAAVPRRTGQELPPTSGDALTVGASSQRPGASVSRPSDAPSTAVLSASRLIPIDSVTVASTLADPTTPDDTPNWWHRVIRPWTWFSRARA